MDSRFELEDVHSIEQYDRVAAMRNPFYWLMPCPGFQLKAFDEEFNDDIARRKVLVREDGQDVGYLRAVQAFWSPTPGVFSCSVVYPLDAHRADRANQLIDILEPMAAELGAKTLSIWAHSDHPEQAEALRTHGYASGQINPFTASDLDAFDPAPFDEAIKTCQAAGYEIITLSEYERRCPESWLKKYYDLDNDIMSDVPLPDPWQAVPIDMFEKALYAPGSSHDLMFVAVRDGELAGSTALFQNLVDPQLGNTGLTGCRREHRRQGVATALKVTAMNAAKKAGILKLTTDNEEKNPMLDLNLRLGFKPVLTSTEFRRTLA